MIIIGYQGIGKSTLAGKYGYIDLESGNFWVDGKRAEDWYVPYCKIANHLSEQGFTVFVSSHEVVRKELEKSKEKVYAICPSTDLKYDWIDKLRTRWEESGLTKDYKAYMNAVDKYEENISDLKYSGFYTVVIDRMDYRLGNIIACLRWNMGREFRISNDDWRELGAHLMKGE